MLKTALVSAGYVVVAVEDGLSALQRMETAMPAAIVLDIALPRLSGRDVQRELAARPATSRIPIVAVTGTDISELDPTHFAAILRKPVHPDEIVQAVDTALRRAGSGLEPA